MIVRRRFPADALLPHLLTALIAVALWNVFFPAIMSTDSLLQYEQATTREFTDWHPPIMAIALSGFIGSGLDIAGLALLQCLGGVFGVQRLASALLAFVWGDALSRRARVWLSFAVLLVVLVPVTPWLFYLMTFWKDVWAMIAMLWIAAGALDAWRGAPDLSRRAFALRLALLVAVMVLLGAVRHNALPVLVVLGAVVAVLGRRAGVRFATALLIAPLAAYLAFQAGLTRAFHVRHEPIANTVMTLDLVGMCVLDARVCADLPYTSRSLLGDAYRARYRFGEYEPLETDPPVLAHELVAEADNPALVADYRRALLSHPLTLARVKLRAFASMLGFDETVYYVESTVEENDLGLAMNSRWSALREELAGFAWSAAQEPIVRWVSAVHAVWIGANLAWLVALNARWRGTRDRRYLFLALVLLNPLGYYATYLAATVARDYRYMAPATLAVQIVTVAAVVGFAANRIRLHRSAKQQP